MKKLLLLLILLPTLCFAVDEYPTVGSVYGLKENKHIKYFCTKGSANTLACDFEMTNVRLKLKQTEYDKKLKEGIAQALDEYEKDSPKKDKEKCKQIKNQMENIIKMYEGKIPLSEKAKITSDYLKQLKPQHIKDMKVLSNTVIKMQCNPTKDVWKALPKNQLDKDLRTCLVGTQTWKQTFKKTGNSWVNNVGAQGTCGTIDISRFVRGEGIYGKGFWNYISEKKVINKSEDSRAGLVKCSDFDEEAYEYIWNNGDEFPISCDYIEWSMY